MSEHHLRPPVAPARPDLHPLRRRTLDWIRWFGPARLAVATISAVAVLAGGYWIVQAPPPSGASESPAGTPGHLERSDRAAVPLVSLVGAPPMSVPSTVVVHVAGAVADPGLHELPPGSRVADAVVAAGGPSADANLDALNLAAPLADGQRLHVPREGEPVESIDGPMVTAPPPPVDLNRATTVELETLPGVGPTIATAIVDDRTRHGAFASVDELVRVRGIGPAKLEVIRPLVTV